MTAVTFFRRRFAEVGDPADAPSQKAYMKSALAFAGVSAQQVRSAVREYATEHAQTHAELRRDVDALFASDSFDLHSAAVGLLERRRKQLERGDDAWLIDLVRKASCWAHVDWLATKVIPHALAPKPGPQLRRWAKDELFWVRRTALLAQLDVLRAGGGDFELFGQLAVPMLGEREFFIRKAIGWVLRDVSRKRPELVRAFVAEHGEKMSGLTRREATRRLPAKP